MKNDPRLWWFVARSALALFSATLAASAQTAPPDHPSTDAEKIADALRAGPRFITKDAMLLDWPTTAGGEYRVLRQGTNEWTCLPGFPGWSHDEPACFDPTFMQWMKDSLAGREPHIDRIGISYMDGGAWVPTNRQKIAGQRAPSFMWVRTS
jgi:hypothetical protein